MDLSEMTRRRLGQVCSVLDLVKARSSNDAGKAAMKESMCESDYAAIGLRMKLGSW